MDRFLDTADPQKKGQSKALQAELNLCRDRLHLLTREKVSRRYMWCDGLC
jgi:ubiquitin carboxyl-terminal hydrolase 25